MRTLNRVFSLLLLAAILAGVCYVPALAASPYYVVVDCYTNIVTVYKTEDNSIVRQMICSSGMYTNERKRSPQGTFTMPVERKNTERQTWYTFEDGYGKFGTRITGNYLFHSFLFRKKDDNAVDWETYAAMGTNASHGCIRLYIEDAKWISEHCFAGTKVKVYTGKTRYDYLKELLYAHSFSIDDCTYAEFVGMASADGELGYYSKGDDVTALQERMIELGLYSGEADGFYDETLVRSVKAVQTALGRKATGVADAELIELLNSDDAPSSILSTLKEGMSGPAVSNLQRTLTSLGLYNGEITGDYDEETVQAVKFFQRISKLEQDGIATPALRQGLLDAFDKLDELFPETGYALAYEESIVESATIDSSKRLNVRAKKSTDSSIVARLDPGTEVSVLDHTGNWTKIGFGDAKSGYVRTDYLKFTQETVQTPTYVAADAEHPALDGRPDYGENVIGAQSVTYATVNTEDDRLYVRQAPSSGADLLFMLSPGTPMRVLSSGNSWAYVTYGGKSGYARTEFLKMTSTAELTGSFVGESTYVPEVKELPDNTVYAMLNGSTPLRSIASDNGDVVAELVMFDQGEVLLEGTSWTQIRVNGMTGYVKNEVLLTGTKEELAETEASIRKTMEVNCVVSTGSEATLNLREAPDSEAELLAKLENGTVLQVIEQGETWSQVRYGQVTGYVMTQYIRVIDDSVEAYDPEEAGYEETDEEPVPEEDVSEDLLQEEEIFPLSDEGDFEEEFEEPFPAEP